jgi:hypothetical protein
LRFQTEPARLSVRLLGVLEPPAEPLDLALQVPPLRNRSRIHRLREALAGQARLLERRGPVAAQPQELSAVHEAPPSERDQIRLLLAPACQCGGPLMGAPHLVDLFAGENDAAVDDAADDRRHLACSHCHHRFVQQAEAFGYASALRKHSPLNVHGEREEVDVTEALTDLGRCGCGGGRAVEVAAHFVLKSDRQEHVTVLDALALFALEQPLRAAEPTGGRSHLPA